MTTMTTREIRAALMRAIDYGKALEVLANAGIKVGRDVDAWNDHIIALATELRRRVDLSN